MSAVTDAQAALNAAQLALAQAEINAQISATPANVAAVKALTERVLSDANALDAAQAAAGASNVTPTPVTPTIGLSGPQPVTPTTTTDAPPPVQTTTGDQTGLTPAAIAAALDGYLSDDDQAISAFIDNSGTPNDVTTGWNYLRDQVENVFSDLGGDFDAVIATGFGDETGIQVGETALGVTADMADFEPVAFGTALLLGEYAFGWLIKQTAKVFPPISIFGWHPLNFIQEGMNNLGNQFEQSASDYLDDISNLFIQPIRQLVSMIQRSVNAVASAHDKTARIVQDTVPSAITKANDYTDTQVSAQKSVVEEAAAQALAQLQPPPTIAQAHQIIADANAYGTLVWQFEAVAAAAIIAAGTYTDNTKTQTDAEIATAKAQAETDAQNAVTNLQASLISRLQGDETTLSAVSMSINTTIPDEIATKVNEAQATENQALTAQGNQLQGEIDTLQSQVTTLQSQVTNANQTIATAKANIANLQSADEVDESAIAQQQATIAAAQAVINTATTAISDLYTQITTISDTLTPIQTTQQLQTSQISSLDTDVELAIPTALATISGIVNSLKTEVDECMVDNCDTTNPNNIRNVLRDLLGLFTAAGEIGFVAEAIKDPLGTASALAPLLEGIDDSASSALNLLLSL